MVDIHISKHSATMLTLNTVTACSLHIISFYEMKNFITVRVMLYFPTYTLCYQANGL